MKVPALPRLLLFFTVLCVGTPASALSLADFTASAEVTTDAGFPFVEVSWSVDDVVHFTQQLALVGFGDQHAGPLALDLASAPSLLDTNAILDPAVDKVELEYDSDLFDGIVVDVAITLRGSPNGQTSGLQEIITIVNDSALTLSFVQVLIPTLNGDFEGDVFEQINDNTVAFSDGSTLVIEGAVPAPIAVGTVDGQPAWTLTWEILPGETLALSKVKSLEVPEPSPAALLGLAFLGLLAYRTRRHAFRAAGGAAALLLVGSAGSAQAISIATLTDEEASVEISTGGALIAEWWVEDVLHVTQSFQLLLEGNNVLVGDPFDTQLVNDDTATVVFADFDDNQEIAWLVEITFDLTGTPAGVGQSDLGEQISILNFSDDSFLLVQAVRTTLGGDGDGDEAELDGNVATITDGNVAFFEEVVVPLPDQADVLAPNVVFFGWDVGPGETVLIAKDKRLEVPEPAGLALLGMGLLGLVLAGSRRSRG